MREVREHDLENHTTTLRELDKYRKESAKLRDEGFRALDAWVKEHISSSAEPPDATTLPELHHRALLIKAYSERSDWPKLEKKEKEKIQGKIKALTKGISTLTLENIKKPDLSVLNAALLLQALTSVPGFAYSKTALLCLYWIIRELHSIAHPDWGIGGARAHPDGSVTAFTTGECVRAILSFAEAQQNTAQFFTDFKNFMGAKERLDSMGDIDALSGWTNKEKERLRLSYHFTFQALRHKFSLPETFCDKFYNKYSDSNLKEFSSDLKGEIEKIIKAAEHAEKAIENHYKEVKETSTEYAHNLALKVIKDVIENTKDAKNALPQPNTILPAAALEQLASICEKAIQDLRKTLDPSQNYLLTVLDHQLALAAAGGNRQWEPSELVCAAATYGWLTGEWNEDHRFQEVAPRLEGAITNRGKFLHSVPFHASQEGAAFPAHAELLHSYAQLLRHVKEKDYEIKPELVGWILCFFKDTREDTPSKNPDNKGWCYEYASRPHCFDLETTCCATLALARIRVFIPRISCPAWGGL